MQPSNSSARAHLHIFSSVCSNLIVFWLIAAFDAQDLFTLTRNLSAAILAWYLAFRGEF